jgi:anaerobic magnesium-protoporphyrin IX monomethyl ester cyclase
MRTKWAKISSIEHIHEKATVYDISTGTENFFANGILVHNCNYCNVHTIYGGQRKVWYRDIDKFLAEIDLLVNKYHVRNIKLWDEHFTVNRKRVIEICDKLIERKYDLNIWAYARVDTIEPIMLDKMGKAGINWLGVGFESGDDEVLAQVSKRAGISQAESAVKIIHDAGINVMGNFILFDGQSKESMKKTMDFAKFLNIEFINLYVGENYPGSDSYKGQEKPWEQYGQFSPNLPQTEVRKFRDVAFNDYFLDGKYLKHIAERFGVQAVNQVKDMIAFGKPQTR